MLASAGLRCARRPGGLGGQAGERPWIITFLPFQVGQPGCQCFRKDSPGRGPACPSLGTERGRRSSETWGSPGRRGHQRDVLARDPGPGTLLPDAGSLHLPAQVRRAGEIAPEGESLFVCLRNARVTGSWVGAPEPTTLPPTKMSRVLVGSRCE